MKCDLKHFRCSLSNTNLLEGANFADANFVFQVLGVYCYLGDATYLSSLPNALKEKCEEPIYLYDVIITDGSYKQKCLLRPDLSSFVQKKVLEVGSQIHVTHAILQQHERDQIVASYIILCKIEVKGHFPFPDPGTIPFLPTKNNRENEPRPLVTGRQYYLNTWLMNIPYKTTTAVPVKFDKNTHELNQPLVTLKDLSDEWKSLPRPYPPLLVTVLLQGKLHHYGKNTTDGAYPFQGYIEIGDDTGICSAVFWQSSIISFFTSIQPGTILLLQNYNVIPKYPRCGTPVIRHTLKELEHFNLEIKLNKSSEVYFVDTTQVAEIIQHNIHLPLPRYWFATRDVLGQLPPDTNVDVIGLVTYVGRYIREPCTARNGSKKGGFWVYRWIELIDGTSPLPIILQVYIHGQENLHKKLMPGQILVCSQLLVACIPLYVTQSHQRRLFYLTTTSESRFTICNEKSLAHEKEYKRLNQLLKEKEHDVAHLQSSVYRVGGSYHFPLCQQSLEMFQLAFPEERPFQVTPCLAWKKVITELSYKEYRRIAVVGTIIQVEFVDLKSNEDGWIKGPYRRKHHCLFLDVCRKQDAKFQETIGIGSFCTDVFAHQYREENEPLLQSWLSFAPFSADEHHKEYTEEEMTEIPVLCNGYYCIDIIGVQSSYTIRAMMLPPPSDHPHPGLLKLLSGNYRQLRHELIGNLCTKPPKYVESEIKCIQKTAQEIGGMKFICVLDLYCHSVGKVEIVLKQAFVLQGTEDNLYES